ncbi:hypothetical protein BDF22DRAFT_51149 [Syncephalis plumigaleata]|nr:hypothetical protein BDF22DRAFT_51149 [Syncephalis plumigaleata]
MIHYRAVKFVCTFLFFTFIVDVALWSTQLQRVSALVTFHIKNQTVSFHTQDPFQVRVPVYIYEGVLIQAEFDDSEDCVLKFEPNSPVVANNTQAIISIKEKKSYKQGCETMVKAVEAVVQLGKQFESSGGPSIVAVLYLLDFKKGNVPGAPRDTKYTVRGLSFSNGAPPIHTALMPESQFEEVIPKPKKQTEPIMVLLQQEPGPWNDVFLAGEFIAYTYVLMGVTIIFVIRSLVILAGIVRSGKYPTKMRIAIYVSAFIGAILFIATLPMNPFTEGYQLIYRIMELFLVISFHLLILLWHHFINE